jgi:hypothetical protein
VAQEGERLPCLQPWRAETIAGGSAQVPRPGLGHRKETFLERGNVSQISPLALRPELA